MSAATEFEFEANQIEEAQNLPGGAPVQGRTQWQLTWRRLRSDKVSMIALTVIVIMVLLAIFAPAVAALTHHPVNTPYPVQGENEDGNPVGPGVNGFLLGTDSTGRDLLVRILYGARISLFVGVVTTLIASVLGVARSLGAGPFRIMFFDILPNLLAPVLVIGTLYIPTAVVFESTLSFLGLGVQPPTPSWGNMLADAENFYQVAWWYLVFPAAALLITTLAFNLLGDGIRDAMDPRTEKLIAARRMRRGLTRRSINKGNKEALGGLVASGTAAADTGKRG
jgi:ABC-type dipeptide/oligopeptide/nickel transport system permease subunit